ncbi:hypothetical protein IHE44_0009432 [Lamprotornis superbus]|uniref:Triadin n=1 Tax=Lamprotornis superbus TaxID=245042 RepID=A0A835U1Q7_9PASS|nr:hypothetical protein IHE44_0009432 [Lamprotornis superbus]
MKISNFPCKYAESQKGHQFHDLLQQLENSKFPLDVKENAVDATCATLELQGQQPSVTPVTGYSGTDVTNSRSGLMKPPSRAGVPQDQIPKLIDTMSQSQTLGLLAFWGAMLTHQRAGHSSNAGTAMASVAAGLERWSWPGKSSLRNIQVRPTFPQIELVQLKLHSIGIIEKEINKERVVEGHMSTTTTIIDGKNGSVPSSSMKVGKKSVTEDLVTTFSSPAAWLLVVALIVTWSAVAIVMFDLVDYKTLAGRSVHKLSTEPLRIIHETLEESSDWIYGFFSLLSDIVWSDDDDDSDEAIHRDKPEKQEKIEKKEPSKVTSKDKLERQEKPEKREKHAAVHKEKPEKPEKQEKKAPSKEEKKVKSTKVEAKVKKEVKDGKGEAKTAEKVKQTETKTTETGLIKAKTKVKEEKALQTVTKSDKKDQYAFCRYVIDMFAQGDFYPGLTRATKSVQIVLIKQKS